jgi:hypothetical protein
MAMSRDEILDLSEWDTRGVADLFGDHAFVRTELDDTIYAGHQ